MSSITEIVNYINSSSSLFHNLYHFPEIDSTNSQCFLNKDEKNFIVLSDKQTKGRGRFQRRWESSLEGNLYVSLCVLHAELEYHESVMLTAVSVLGVLKNLNQQISLKWPNDLMYQQKKVGGILIEREYIGENIEKLIIGLGINLFTDFSFNKELKYKAISLKYITSKEINREALLLDIIKCFEKNYYAFPLQKESLRNRWKDEIMKYGSQIQFKIDKKVIKGELKNINDDGSIVLLQNNKEYTFHVGEVV